ncbi:MAG TPA: hypothetical protein DIW23_05575 [Anaerolineae bacterium]|nr:hypothetical protein [Anaerolineae bacterium]
MNLLPYLLAPIVVAYSFSMVMLIIYLINMVYLAFIGLRKQKYLQQKNSLLSLPTALAAVPGGVIIYILSPRTAKGAS